MQGEKGECSAVVSERVTQTRNIQWQRNNTLNSQLTQRQMDDACTLNKADLSILQHAVEKLRVSARAYRRILKLTRTIADMDSSTAIKTQHLLEAVGYRKLDRQNV